MKERAGSPILNDDEQSATLQQRYSADTVTNQRRSRGSIKPHPSLQSMCSAFTATVGNPEVAE